MHPCDDCIPCCEFCAWYDFNGEIDGYRLVYTGDGFCTLICEPRNPEDFCDGFECINAVDIALE